MKSKILVQSNGGARDTRVYADGCDVTAMVRVVRWEHVAPNLPSAELELFSAPIDASGALAGIVAPDGRVVKKIIFDDGTEISAED